jgi:NAD-dependent dihydropyrimidine dehydrogenase PreA subunit
MADDFFSKWHGLDRTAIEWYPIVEASKCSGCGLCVVTCGEKRNVFGYNTEKKKAVVIFPDHCMVGCDNCATGCLWGAITFPKDITYIRTLSSTLSKEQIEKELGKKLKENPELVIE